MGKNKYNKYLNTSIASAVVASSAVVVAPSAPAATNFSDVKPSHYFYDAVKSLAEREIMKGLLEGKFHPNEHVTRGQAAKIIASALGLDTKKVKNPGFTDIPTHINIMVQLLHLQTRALLAALRMEHIVLVNYNEIIWRKLSPTPSI